MRPVLWLLFFAYLAPADRGSCFEGVTQASLGNGSRDNADGRERPKYFPNANEYCTMYSMSVALNSSVHRVL